MSVCKDKKQRLPRQKGVLLPRCVICEETPPGGIAGGIVVSGCFLCTRCEKEIVRLRIDDSRYANLKEKIKKMWGLVRY